MSDLDFLSDAEREALEDEDLDATPVVDDEDDAEEEAEGDDAGASENDDGAEPEDPEEPEALAARETLLTPGGDLGKIDGDIEALKSERDRLEALYEASDSDLSYGEHRAKVREIEDAIADLKAERAEIKAVQRVSDHYQQEWWNREIRNFKRAAAKEGVDYDGDKKLEAEWDKAVRFLGNDPENADKSADWFLKEAHEMVKARFKLGQAPAAQPAKPRSRVDEALAARRAKAGRGPVSLAQLPEAGSEAEGESEFSHLDRLSGMALERALAKMTPDQQDRYLTQ